MIIIFLKFWINEPLRLIWRNKVVALKQWLRI
jgi:hypothetical protein